jgi:hypothetical protein
MRRKIIATSAVATIVLAVTLWKVKAQQPTQPDLSGEWELVSAVGTTPPDEFVMKTDQSATTFRVHSRWKEPGNGEYGLMLVGLLTPELTFSIGGGEDLNQSGPFVIHSKTQWRDARLMTTWNTSELLGVSFEGEWVRSVSADGRESTLEIHAKSSQGRRADAVLLFRKK